jgi:YegS/Rv2252/BmrU family lipid kinase
MHRALVVSNPASSRSNPRFLEVAVHELQRGGMSLEMAVTSGPGHAASLAHAAAREGIDLLIANGGDGTVGEVAGAAALGGIRLGILPSGTGNLLARNLGIPRRAVAASQIILRNHVQALDLGWLRSNGAERYFTVACGAGFDAQLMERTPLRLKKALGLGSYVLTGIRLAACLPVSEVDLEVEGETCRLRAAAILAANCRCLIPGLPPLHAQVRPDDGLLDVAVFDAASFRQVASQTFALALRRAGRHPGIRFMRGRRIRVSATPAMPAECDGDLAGSTPLSIDLLPGALKVLVPA